jgi:hypothetical protein
VAPGPVQAGAGFHDVGDGSVAGQPLRMRSAGRA